MGAYNSGFAASLPRKAVSLVKLRPESPWTVVLLTMLVALGPLSTDLYLPSLPAIGQSFETDSGRVQLTLSVFLVGFAFSQLVYGPLSDRFGRRPVLLGGLALYAVASVLCMTVQTIEGLIAARFLQAVGACVGPVLGRAVARDIFPRDRVAQVLSYMAMAMALAPAVGPALGGYLQVLFGWQASFAILAVCGLLALFAVAVALPETNGRKDASATRPHRILANYRTLAGDSVYRSHVLTHALVFCGLFAFISGSSFVLIETVGLSPDRFGIAFGVIVLGYILGSFVSARLTRRLGLERMILLGLSVALAAALPMAVLAFAAPPNALAVIVPVAVFMAGAGMVLPNAMAAALGPFPQMAGAASALLGFVQMSAAAGVGVLVGQLSDGSARAMAVAISLGCLLALMNFLATRSRAFPQPVPADAEVQDPVPSSRAS